MRMLMSHVAIMVAPFYTRWYVRSDIHFRWNRKPAFVDHLRTDVFGG